MIYIRFTVNKFSTYTNLYFINHVILKLFFSKWAFWNLPIFLSRKNIIPMCIYKHLFFFFYRKRHKWVKNHIGTEKKIFALYYLKITIVTTILLIDVKTREK